jgi:hypothetical protein
MMKKIFLYLLLVVVPVTGCTTMTPEEMAAYQKRKAQERAACDQAFAACFLNNGGINGAMTLKDKMNNITIAEVCQKIVRCN